MANKFLDGLKNVLGQVAPGIGAAFGGPLGGAAGTILKRKLLGKEDATDEELATAVAEVEATGKPEDIVKMREADLEFQKFLEENNLKVMELDTEDRASARAREVALKDWTPTALAFAITAGFFCVMLWILKWGMPTNGEQVLTLMLGSLGTAWIGVVNYYFGSSSGSKAARSTLDAIAVKKST